MSTTNEMTRDDLVSMLRMALDQAVRHADKLTAEFMESVEKNGLVYAVSWSESDLADCALGDLCRSVYRRAERQDVASTDEGLALALRATFDEATKDLLANRLRGSSTSMASNAAEAGKREAAARFVNRFGYFLDGLS